MADAEPGFTELARAVAIAGDGTGLGRASALAVLDPAARTLAADALAEAGVFAAGDPLGFVHPLVREAVSASPLPNPLRAQWCRSDLRSARPVPR